MWTTSDDPSNCASSISSGSACLTKTRSKCSAAAAASSCDQNRSTSLRASACLASLGESPAGAGARRAAARTSLHRAVRQAQRLAIDLLGGLVDADVVAQRLGHLARPVDAGEDRHRQRDLLVDPVGALHVAPEQEVELLIGAAELDVGAHGDRVVGLHERIEQLEDRDRLARRVALGEVVALEQLRDGRRARRARTAPPSSCPATRSCGAARCATGRGPSPPGRRTCARWRRSARPRAAGASTIARSDRRHGRCSRR